MKSLNKNQVDKRPWFLASLRKKLKLVLGPLFLTLLCFNLHSQFEKRWVLQQNKTELQALGRHFIVGFKDFDEVAKLAELGAIAGVYWSRSHFYEKTLSQIKAEINALQKIRQQAGLPKLVMSLDEEGGIVSALQIHLGPQLSLADFAEAHGEETKTQASIRAFALKKARRLKNLGFNVNFSPVVDLKFPIKQKFWDRHSFIGKRSPGSDPHRVAHRGLEYAQALLSVGMTPTLKHFPGLGRVAADTHLQSGVLTKDLATLQASDLMPFQKILAKSTAWTMLSHTKMTAIDNKNPVSVSQKVIQQLLREAWQHEGILITDDLSMGPIVRRRGGVGQAAIDALNAGVDYLLISKDPELFYPTMKAALQASRKGKLERSALVKSAQRMDRWQQQEKHLASNQTSFGRKIPESSTQYFTQSLALANRYFSTDVTGLKSLFSTLKPR